jgi:hypothetical protein
MVTNSLTSKQLGDEAFKKSLYDEAILHYNDALTNTASKNLSDRAAIHSNKSITLLRRSPPNPSLALKEAQAAIALRPRWPKAHIRLAQSHESLQNLPKAIQAYQAALQLLKTASADASSSSFQIATLTTKLGDLHQHASQKSTLASLRITTPTSTTKNSIYTVAPHPQDASILALSLSNGTVHLCRLSKEKSACNSAVSIKTITTLTVTTPNNDNNSTNLAVPIVVWSPSGNILAAAGLYGMSSLKLWHFNQTDDDDGISLQSISLQHDFDDTAPPPLTTEYRYNNIIFIDHDDGDTLVVASSTDGHLWVWRRPQQQPPSSSSSSSIALLKKEAAHPGSFITSLSTSQGKHHQPQEKCDVYIASSAGDAHFKLWRLSSTSTSSTDMKMECVQDVGWESGPVTSCRYIDIAISNDDASSLSSSMLLTCHVKKEMHIQEGRILGWMAVPPPPPPPPPPLPLFNHHHHDQAIKAVTYKGWVDGQLVAPCLKIDGIKGRIVAWDILRLADDDGTAMLSCSGSSSMSYMLAAVSSSGVLSMYEVSPQQSQHNNKKKLHNDVDDMFNSDWQGVEMFSMDISQEHQPSNGSYSNNNSELPPSSSSWQTTAMQHAAHSKLKVALGRHVNTIVVAVTDAEHTIRVVDVDSGAVMSTLIGHSAPVRSLQWLPYIHANDDASSSCLISAGEDGLVKLWKIQ